MYQLINDEQSNPRTDVIRRIADCAFIPNNSMNRDWVAYQAWLALGNTPEAAE